MAPLLVDENCEGAGYEESWTEVKGGSSTVDEDSAFPAAGLAGSGSQCLACTINSTDVNAYAYKTLSGDQNIAYISYDFYGDVERLGNAELVGVLAVLNSGGLPCCIVQWVESGGNQYLRLGYYSGTAMNYTAVPKIFTLQQWYRIEFRYDLTNSVWSWYRDEVLQDSGALAAATRTPRVIGIGLNGHTAGDGTTRCYIDQVHWNTERYMGFARNRIRKVKAVGLI